MTPDAPTFDEQVAALRGKVTPCVFWARKAQATPERWAAHLDALAPAQSRYRARHPDRKKASGSYASPASKERRRERSKARRRGDLSFSVACSLRSRLCSAVKNGQKTGSAIRDLGCTVDDLKAHIESQFQPGMTWNNRGVGDGRWSIDHDYPCSQADLTDRAQLLAVCNWRNLQPMWHGDNVRKGDEVSESAREKFEVLANFAEVLGG
jgi:hypothetical protein